MLISGAIAARLGKQGEAVELLRKAAERDPDSYDAARWLATLLIGKGDGQEAVRHARNAVRLRPTEAGTHAVLGLARLAAADSNQAIASLRKAIELEPRMAGAYHNLGVAYQNEESYEEAIEAFQRAIDLSPQMVASLLHLGNCYLAMDKPDEALEVAKKAVQVSPNSRTARQLIAQATSEAVRGDRGGEHIREALRINPNSAFPNALMGSWLQEEGRFDEAEPSILRSMELDPHQGFSYYLLAHNRKIVEADRPLVDRMEALASDPNVPGADRRQICFALGKAHDDLKDYEKAMHYLDLANEAPELADDAETSASIKRDEARAEATRAIFTREFMERQAGNGSESDQPTLIFGMPRSGTTLLEQVLSRHSGIGAAGEQSFWRDRRRRIIDSATGLIDPSELRKAGQDYLELLSSIGPGKRHVTDKWPGNYVHLGILHLVFPNATFLHATRHPIDICLSIYMRPFLTFKEVGNRKRRVLDTYRLYQKTMDHWREVLPEGRFHEVRYENMVSNQEAMTRDVLSWIGVDWEDACLSPEASHHQVKTFSKWQVRQPVYTTSVERWRRYEPWLGAFRELLDDPA